MKFPLFALDIDGVFLLGKTVIPHATRAISLLQSNRIPFIFMTNGGGVSEYAKSLQLSEALQVSIRADQVLLSHTPMKKLIPLYHDKLIMTCGSSYVASVARSYGFTQVIGVNDVAFQHPHSFTHGPLVPYDFVPEKNVQDVSDLAKIEAVFVMHDGKNWGAEFQTILDVLYAGLLKNGVQTPLYFSNPDFVFRSSHAHPRLAQGAVRVTLEALWKKYTNLELKYTNFGKPNKSTYSLAENMLLKEFQRLTAQNQSDMKDFVFYGIGDNPESDIRGANNAALENNWISVLVKTGLAKENSKSDLAKLVFADVNEAIDCILKKHL